MTKPLPQLLRLPLTLLQPGFYQPRQQFYPTALQALAQAIQSAGDVLQTILVRPIAAHQAQTSTARYEIVAGERLLARGAKRQSAAVSDPNIERLATTLAEHLGAPVSIAFQNGRGQLKIDFHNLDALDGILSHLNLDNLDD